MLTEMDYLPAVGRFLISNSVTKLFTSRQSGAEDIVRAIYIFQWNWTMCLAELRNFPSRQHYSGPDGRTLSCSVDVMHHRVHNDME